MKKESGFVGKDGVPCLEQKSSAGRGLATGLQSGLRAMSIYVHHLAQSELPSQPEGHPDVHPRERFKADVRRQLFK